MVITNETSCKCFLLCSNLCILTRSFSISRFVYVTCGLCGKSLRSMLRLDIPPVFLTGCHLILSFWFHGDFSCIFPYLHGITRLFSQKLQVSLRESSESSENCSHKKNFIEIYNPILLFIFPKKICDSSGYLDLVKPICFSKTQPNLKPPFVPFPTKNPPNNISTTHGGRWIFSGLAASS